MFFQFGILPVSSGTIAFCEASASSMPPPLSVIASNSLLPSPTTIFWIASSARALFAVAAILIPAWASMALQSLAPTLCTPGLAQILSACPSAAVAPGMRPMIAAVPSAEDAYMNARRVHCIWFILVPPFRLGDA